jgi:hypothetical protein
LRGERSVAAELTILRPSSVRTGNRHVLLQVPAAIGSKNQQALAVATGHSVVAELTILSFVGEGAALIQADAMTHCEAAAPNS